MSYQIAHHCQYASEGVFGCVVEVCVYEYCLNQGMVKLVRPAKTLIRLGRCPVWLESFDARIKNLEVISYILSELQIL